MSLYFCVKNFVKIESAKINISNFTVFVGNNNSGKTKLMELIYGILYRISHICPEINLHFNDDRLELRNQEIELVMGYVNAYLKENKEEIVYSIFNQKIAIDEMWFELEDCENWYELFFVKKDNVDTIINMNILDKEDVQRIVQQISTTNQIVILERSLDDNSITRKLCNGASMNIPLQVLEPIIIGDILQILLGVQPILGTDMLFLPASRMGLMLLYKEYFGAQSYDKIELIRKKNQQSQRLTKPVMDFLSFLLSYSYNDKHMNHFAEEIEFINNNLIEGKLNEKGEITTYLPKNEEIEIPLFMSSSMINELDPIVKMLTDKREYSYLFYDEVETSLHPLKQIELVKLLNRLNNKGLKILMSTHSEAFVNKLNNILLLSYSHYISGNKVALCKGKVEIAEEDLLKTENIHIYQFTNKGNGKSEVKALEFRKVPYIGYTFELFEDSANALYEETKIALGIEEC